MSSIHLDPLFNKPHNVKASNIRIVKPFQKKENPQNLQMVEGAFNGKTFKMLVDVNQRIALPVKEQ